MTAKADEDLLAPEDRCANGAGFRCDKPRAAHVGWQNGGPSHEFQEPEGNPKPELYVSAHIQTDWDCARCGAHNNVWGEADGWMECPECDRDSFLVPFMSAPAPACESAENE